MRRLREEGDDDHDDYDYDGHDGHEFHYGHDDVLLLHSRLQTLRKLLKKEEKIMN